MAVTAPETILRPGLHGGSPQKRVMEKRERPTSDLGKTEQPLSEHELKAVNGGSPLYRSPVAAEPRRPPARVGVMGPAVPSRTT